jgi:hypothetical protein
MGPSKETVLYSKKSLSTSYTGLPMHMYAHLCHCVCACVKVCLYMWMSVWRQEGPQEEAAV